MSPPATAGLVVAPAETDAELLEIAAVRRATDSNASTTLENLRHSRNTLGSIYLLARAKGAPVGCGYVGGWHDPDDDPFVYVHFCVVPSERGRGIGSALHAAVSELVRSRGKDGLTLEVNEDDAGSLAWLERHGFVEVERQKGLELELADAPAVDPAPPAGVRLVSRAERTDLERGMYRIGLEAGSDIPGLDGQHAPSFEQWRAFEIERPSRRPELCFVALADDEVVGYASLDVFGVSDTAYHGLTAVARDWRGRGLGSALKRAQIEAARQAGLRRLVTESVEENVPMRRLNAKLGYRPIPGTIVLRGPLAAAKDVSSL